MLKTNTVPPNLTIENREPDEELFEDVFITTNDDKDFNDSDNDDDKDSSDINEHDVENDSSISTIQSDDGEPD